MKPVRIVLLVLGSFLALVSLGLGAAAAGLGWVVATQRDDAGYFTTSSERFETATYALTTQEVDLGSPGPDEWWTDRADATVRLRVDGANSQDIFVGVAREADVEAYLRGVPHQEISDVTYDPFRADYRTEHGGGRAIPTPPADQGIWVAEATGPGTQTLNWDVEPGRWAAVVMNADATPGVVADVDAGIKTGVLTPIAIALGVGSLVLFGLGAALILGGVLGAAATPASPAAAPSPMPVGAPRGVSAYPLALEGHLDPNLSRWQWLVKWFLAIPHFVVLALLWTAFAVLTVVAFFAILFTGRYPRRIFDFNVGVLRWSWRVGFYATSMIATDRYPPFTLADADYPARLDVAYPERLSRGLVLVKSWLLALPHLILVALFTASWGFAGRDGGWFGLNGGLLEALALVAGVALLFTGTYPQGLFDLLMGFNRWLYRVIAYVALMTDRYPPFHLDQGPTEPSAGPPEPPAGPSIDLGANAERPQLVSH